MSFIRSEIPERRLLSGRYEPVTNLIEFIEGDFEEVVQSFLASWGESLTERTGYVPMQRLVQGDLAKILEQAAPVVTGTLHRWIVVPTASDWVAVMTNHAHVHGRPGSTSGFASEGHRVVSVTYVKYTYHSKKNPTGMLGDRAFSLIVPDTNGRFGFTPYRIGVFCNEHGRWEGWDREVLATYPYPDPSDYSKRSKADQFTSEHIEYLAGLYGIRPFDADFYAPDRTAVFLENPEPRDPDWLSLTYEQAQARHT